MPKNEFSEINFIVDKAHIHHWPLDTLKWSNEIMTQVDKDVNKNNQKKELIIRTKTIKIDNYEFKKIKKVGVTIPLFKKQCTLVFEGYFNEVYGHIHVTTKEENYLQIFNELMHWRETYFPDSIEA